MLELSKLSLFFTATIVLLLTPGPAVLYIVARSVDQGRRAGLVSVLGIQTGTLFHIAAAALGLSALLLSSALAFDLVKYFGAAYLIYLGVRKITAKVERQTVEVFKPQSLKQVYRQGMVVNILNPKTALFFFAFLPQFVDSSRGSVAVQIFLLGLLFTSIGVVTDSSYALLAGTLAKWIKGSQGYLRVQRYFIGVIYIGLGLTTALVSHNSASK